MDYPHRDTNMFKLLQSLAINGDMSVEDFATDSVYLMAGGNKRGARESLKRLIDKNFVIELDDCVRITADAKSYVEDVLELHEKIKPGDIVQAPYRNIWSSEIKDYTKSLYANKRGY